MYRVRFLLMIMRCLISATAPVERERCLSFRAIPFDTDVTCMFTHSYALLMGLARWHWLFSSQFRKLALQLALRDKWVPVTTGEIINYRKSIRAFQKFELRPESFIGTKTAFTSNSLSTSPVKCLSVRWFKGSRRPQGVFEPGELFAQAGYEGPVPEPSHEMKERIASLKKSSPHGRKLAADQGADRGLKLKTLFGRISFSAHSGHSPLHRTCPLSGVKAT